MKYLLIVLLGTLFTPWESNRPENVQIKPSLENKPISAEEVVNLIKKNVTCTWAKKTVDTFKEGNPSQSITGIATTFMATMEVLQKAKDAGLNMIITHEPTYYNHFDETTFFANDPVFLKKQKYIRDNKLVVFRFHDHIHRTDPDGIHTGMIKKLGWASYQKYPDKMIFKLPEQSIRKLATALKQLFKATSIRVVGDPNMVVSKIGMAVGAPGSKTQIQMLRNNDVEVLIGGETPEWETVEYVRDAQAQGMKKALILTGHANSEEAGMDYCAQWLRGFIKDIPIEFIQANDPFWTP
jgi:putative NIF3 family GTP cyclohydrolase 1 type 2